MLIERFMNGFLRCNLKFTKIRFLTSTRTTLQNSDDANLNKLLEERQEIEDALFQVVANALKACESFSQKLTMVFQDRENCLNGWTGGAEYQTF